MAKQEYEKVATKLARTFSILSNLSPQARYLACIEAEKILAAQGYGSISRAAGAAAEKFYGAIGEADRAH